MGSRARLQYALGFGLSFLVYLRLLEDAQQSINRQRHLIGLIEKNDKGDITFQSDAPQSPSLTSTISSAYLTKLSETLLKMLNP